MSNADLDKFLGECPAHKKLPWKIGAMESGQVAIDSDDGKEVTGWIDPEDACLILNQQQRIEELERERDTAWAQAHRLALELECLIMDTKDNAVVSKWWDSAFEAIEEYQSLKPWGLVRSSAGNSKKKSSGATKEH